jgi:hypothetical protein
MIGIIIACNIGALVVFLMQKLIKATYRHKWAFALQQIADSQPRSEMLLFCQYCGSSRYLSNDHSATCPVSIAKEALK